jgi:hypothetical protein
MTVPRSIRPVTAGLAALPSVALWAAMALALGGCASARVAAARDGYLQTELETWVYPQPCGTLWPEVLRQVASEGFALVGADRAAAGKPPQSGVANFFSEGYATRATSEGGLQAASDWNRSWVRYVANGTPSGAGCTVRYTRVTQPDTDDPGKVFSAPDWEMALALLRRVDPQAAARVEAGIPKVDP